MSKKVWDGDYDINTNWGGDDTTEGLPLSGEAVQDVIKTALNKLDTGKVGYITETGGIVYFCSTKESFDNGNYMGSVVARQQYAMTLELDGANRYVFLSSEAEKKLFWYFKTIEIQNNNALYEESVSVEYKIKNITEKVDKTISLTIPYNRENSVDGFCKVEMDLNEYLTNGVSTIEIIVKGLKSKQERSVQMEVTIVSLDIEDKTDFSRPFENKIIVSTDINCTKSQVVYYEYKFDDDADFTLLKNGITGDGRTVLNTLEINISDLNNGRHVFEYRLVVNIGSVTYYTGTQRIEFIKGNDHVFDVPQILIFSTYTNGEECIAKDGNLVINGATQYLPFQIRYAVYNSETSITKLDFHNITSGEIETPIATEANRGVLSYYTAQFVSEGSKVIKVSFYDKNGVSLGKGERIFYINVEQSALNIKEFNRNMRINFSSVGKDNSSREWISNVNGVIKQATFSETFDWSQGWTDNGLVISEGCEVVFDYTPFPQQRQDATTDEKNEFVGGDKAYTFEIEFMTQNVTDESSVLCNMVNEHEANDCGLLITGSEIKFTTPNGQSVSTRFKEKETNRVAIVIHPETLDDKDKTFKGLVELYINGVLSSIAKYTKDEAFEVFEIDENENATSKRLKFVGSAGADLVVKYIRAYSSIMTPDEAVDNYIIYRNNSKEMLSLYNKNNVINTQGEITPDAIEALGNIPILIFVGRTVESELASGDGNQDGYDGPNGYLAGKVGSNSTNWYGTLEQTTDKKKNIDMDVIYYNPLDKSKNFKFVKAYITPQGTSSMYYPKKNYRIYTQKNDDTRMFLSKSKDDVLTLEMMLKSNFGESENDRRYEVHRGVKNKKKRVYSFKDNAQAVKCWCLKADFAETSSSHNTGIARLWGETLKNSTVTLNKREYNVFKTNAQTTIEQKYNNNANGDMPDIRTTIDGFPIVVFGKKSYGDEYVFLGKYNFNNDKSTESVFGFCDIDNEETLTSSAYDYERKIKSTKKYTIDVQLDQYMTCVETLDNGNALANFSTVENFDDNWEDAFEFRYPEIPEAPDESDYQDENGKWVSGGEAKYKSDLNKFNNETLPYWQNTHLKPFKHFATWLYSTRWCDVNGKVLDGLTQEEADARKEKFATEKWDHLDVWKMAAYYIYVMRFGAVDQLVKNSMLTSEGPFAFNVNGAKYGEWDATKVTSEKYGHYYKWYYINYDNDTIMGVKNDGSLIHGPEITRQSWEAGKEEQGIRAYAGWDSTLWNNIENDPEFQDIIRIADRGISKYMTYNKAINEFDVEQVGKWCERIYNKDSEYKYISPYMANWAYSGDTTEVFSDKLFMLQGSRTAHRRWWLSRRFNMFDGKWSSGDFASKYIEIKCDYGSIGDTFSAVAGANAYFGYQINNRTFGDGAKDGGTTYNYDVNETINWKLYKVINIGDPIAVYGSNDIVELNLQGISKNLSSVAFQFGSNADLGNKLERFILSIPDDLLKTTSSYKTYSDAEDGTSAFELLQKDYPALLESDFGENGKYPTSDVDFNAEEASAPNFYRRLFVNDDGESSYLYFAKIRGGIRNYSCNTMAFDALDKLQELKMAGYMAVPSIDLSKNKFINSVDVRYSSITNISFGDGSRIRELKASQSLTTLDFVNCNNLKIRNIFIDDKTLSENGGTNIYTIKVENSTGLNHDNDFKAFILKWMTSGNISSKKLTLRNIFWSNVSLEDVNTIRKFLLGNEEGKKAIECIITGTIRIGGSKLTAEDLELLEQLNKDMNGDLVIEIPFANIILKNNNNTIVAGQSTEYDYILFPNAEDILNNPESFIEAYLAVETTATDNEKDYSDGKGRYYKKVKNTDDVREGVRLYNIAETRKIKVETTENIVGKDTNTLVMAILHHDGERYYDIMPLYIKEPTYAASGIINGEKNINKKNTSYEYSLTLSTENNETPLGSIDIDWDVKMKEGDYEQYLSWTVSSDKKTLIITTTNDQYYPVADLVITARVKNHPNSLLTGVEEEFIVEKTVKLLHENVVLTKETNPTVFNICLEQGWITNDTDNPFVMTRSEAEAVEDIGTIFANVKAASGWSFDEFVYFTNTKLNTLTVGAFANSDLTSIDLPANITEIKESAFANCKLLQSVVIPEGIKVITNHCFFNCVKLSNVVLPNSITTIRDFSFGGTGITHILNKDTSSRASGNRAIFLSENASLQIIEDGAFETESWTHNKTTNALRDIFIPKNVILYDDAYKFLLGKNLENVTISTQNNKISCDSNLIYADLNKTKLVRAIPKNNGSNYIEESIARDVQKIYDYAFYNCNTIGTIIIGDGIMDAQLGVGAFYNSGIKVIDLSRCVYLTTIETDTFKDCKQLTSVLFPMNGKLTSFKPKVFENCESLMSLTLPNTITDFEGDLNAGDSETFVNCGFEELVLPDSLINIGRYFLRRCNSLKKLVYPKFFNYQKSSVDECNALEEVVLPIFSYETTVFTVKNGENIIGEYGTREEAEGVAENGNTITEEVISKVVNSRLITESPFLERCYGLKRFILHELDDNKLMISDGGVLYKIGRDENGRTVPQDKEITAVPYSFTSIDFADDTKCIGGFFTTFCNNITELVIPNSITTLSSSSFWREDNSTLFKVDLSQSNVTEIPNECFKNIKKLNNVLLPKNLIKIGNDAFNGCSSITNIELGNSVTELGQYAFAGSGLLRITLPQQITKISIGLFQSCQSLEEVYINGDITNIERFAFSDCKKIYKIVLKDSTAAVIEASNYHSFGYSRGGESNTYMGKNSGRDNNIYLPYDRTGYDAKEWISPLTDKDKCNFNIQTITLSQKALIKVFDGGEEVTDATLYFESDSKQSKFESGDPLSTQYDKNKGGYILSFDLTTIYYNEPIKVYRDKELTIELGTFIAKEDTFEYIVGATMGKGRSRNMVLGSSQNEDSVNISKQEYETLLSRVNQLTAILNKLKL